MREEEAPVRTRQGGARGLYRAGLKRALDVILVLLAVPVIFPVVGGLVLIVAFGGGAPLYSQMRVGRNGRVFRLWKIRSMARNADAVLEAYLCSNPERRAEWDLKQKLDQDPRITGIGYFIRGTSLDELPQLWNVLRGDMSLVGPRPMMVDQQPLYPGQAYYRMRPGLTGLWQISQRNESSFRARAGFDDEYERSITFLGDVRIILATIRVVLNATGR